MTDLEKQLLELVEKQSEIIKQLTRIQPLPVAPAVSPWIPQYQWTTPWAPSYPFWRYSSGSADTTTFILRI